MLVVGITGGVGAGKSSVLQALKEHCKAKITLADDVGNKVKEPGQKCYLQIVDLLGEDVLMSDKSINKVKMAEKIFSNNELLEKVNEIIHPAVEEYILQDIEKQRNLGEIDVYFLEAAHTENLEKRACIVSHGEGNGTPLQYSCLENPMDGGAW